MNDQSFESVVSRLCAPDSPLQYDSEAWYFLRDGIDRALSASGSQDGARREAGAREICESLRDLALEQFGPMALLVLSQWGVYETADFGRMVGALVGEGVFSRSKGDAEKDFDGVYDFGEAFDAPFLPPSFSRRAEPKKARK
jgi:uncharacterized repeat protein (TIGR04138 family)